MSDDQTDLTRHSFMLREGAEMGRHLEKIQEIKARRRNYGYPQCRRWLICQGLKKSWPLINRQR